MDQAKLFLSSFGGDAPGPDPDPGDPIGQSLRFRGGQRLIGTPVTVPSGDFTLSFWLKRGDDNSQTGSMSLFIGSPNYGIQIGNSNQTPKWGMFARTGGAVQISSGSLSDYSAWYHCVFSTTGGNTTFYLNGETQLTTASPASANTVLIGSNAEASQDDPLRAYLADYYCIDGQALEPTVFGRYNDFDVWVPVSPQGLTFGANGFHLDFSDPSNIGKDVASGNDFTAIGFETVDTSSPDYDLMQDSPTQNFATGNPLMVGIDGGTLIQSFTRANLGWNGMNSSGALPYGYASIRIPMGVRAYCEWQATQTTTTAAIGVSERRPTEDRAWGSAGAWTWGIDTRSWIKGPDGTTSTAPGNWINPVGSVASAEVNTTVTPPTVTFRLNGDDATAETRTFNADFDPENIWFGGNSSTAVEVAMNFGQQPFLYQPADTVALQTANLTEATIRNGRDHFQAITDTGANILTTAQATFDNGLYIIKSRTNSEQWQYFDTINGETSVPRTPANTAPQTYFEPAGTALAWCWSAPDAFTNADVTAGRSNVAAGFSMVNYTGNGADLRTITHGLDRAPGLIIHFNPAGGDVKVWIAGLTGTGRDTQNLVLNTGEAASNQFGAGAIHAPENATEMIVGRNAEPGGTGVAGVNDNGALYRAFIWAPIPGYSAFGNFTGAGGPGNDAPFIYTGFKPALVWIQASGEAGGDSFFTADTTCQTFNPFGSGTILNMAQSSGEGVNSARPWDMLSNGFKIRTNSGSLNRTNVVWAAWAENPFSSPATAR